MKNSTRESGRETKKNTRRQNWIFGNRRVFAPKMKKKELNPISESRKRIEFFRRRGGGRRQYTQFGTRTHIYRKRISNIFYCSWYMPNKRWLISFRFSFLFTGSSLSNRTKKGTDFVSFFPTCAFATKNHQKMKILRHNRLFGRLVDFIFIWFFLFRYLFVYWICNFASVFSLFYEFIVIFCSGFAFFLPTAHGLKLVFRWFFVNCEKFTMRMRNGVERT